MNEKELKKSVQELQKVVNKRYDTLKKYNSPAYESLKESGGKIATKGKGLNQLRNEFKRARNFLQSKTSTVSGYFELQEKLYGKLEFDKERDLTDEEKKAFWKAYRKMNEENPAAINRYGSTHLIEDTLSKYKSNDEDYILEQMREDLKEFYEKQNKLKTPDDVFNEI